MLPMYSDHGHVVTNSFFQDQDKKVQDRDLFFKKNKYSIIIIITIACILNFEI